MAIRAVIAEDEPIARGRIRKFLDRTSDCEVVGECRNGRETIEAVQLHKPDLLFLDIQMPDIDGFSVLRALEPQPLPAVVFVTAFDEYAVSAFEVHALDYLLKPFDEERFQKAVARARSHVFGGEGNRTTQFRTFLQDPNVSRRARQLVIRSAGRVVFLRLSEIDWIESAANYVRIHAGADSYLFRDTMTSIEDQLTSDQFLRIHRSIVVNTARIKELKPCGNGEYLVKLCNGKVLPMSRAYREVFEEFLKESRDIRNLLR